MGRKRAELLSSSVTKLLTYKFANRIDVEFVEELESPGFSCNPYQRKGYKMYAMGVKFGRMDDMESSDELIDINLERIMISFDKRFKWLNENRPNYEVVDKIIKIEITDDCRQSMIFMALVKWND